MPRHLISDAHEWINEIPTVPIYYLAKPQPRERAWKKQRGKKTLQAQAGLSLSAPTARRAQHFLRLPAAHLRNATSPCLTCSPIKCTFSLRYLGIPTAYPYLPKICQ